MVAIRGAISALVSIAMIVVLSGCSDFARGFRQSDAIGVWKSDSYPSVMQLEIQKDSSFTAVDWPGGICDIHLQNDWRNLDWKNKISFSGVLTLDDGKSSYSGFLDSRTDACKGIVSIYFWRSATGDLSLKLLLDSADDASKYSELVLTKQ